MGIRVISHLKDVVLVLFALCNLVVSAQDSQMPMPVKDLANDDGLSSNNVVLPGYRNYATFDEYTMRGVGEVSDSALRFVYVKSSPTRIVVRVSNDISDSIVYNYVSGHWEQLFESHVGERMHKCLVDMPRHIWRYFVEDSIVEYCEHYDAKECQSAYCVLKQRNGDCLRMVLKNPLQHPISFGAVLAAIEKWRESDNLEILDDAFTVSTPGVLWLKKRTHGTAIYYECQTKRMDVRYRFLTTGLGDYDVPPGLEVTKSHYQPVEYYRNRMSEMRKGAYLEVDNYATCIYNKEELDALLKLMIKEKHLKHFFSDKWEYAILRFKVDSNGELLDVECNGPLSVKFVNYCKSFFKFKPGNLDGFNVPSWVGVKISIRNK